MLAHQHTVYLPSHAYTFRLHLTFQGMLVPSSILSAFWPITLVSATTKTAYGFKAGKARACVAMRLVTLYVADEDMVRATVRCVASQKTYWT